MSAFPDSPRVVKGALVGVSATGPPSVVVFQYNPESLTRTLTPHYAQDQDSAGRSQVARLTAPPEETIRLDVELDALDQLVQGDPATRAAGLYPVLSALEMLIYPSAARVIANEVLANLGMIEVVPPEAPLTLLVWGARRILPVRLTDLSITEQAFDPDLNPLRARASASLRVLTYDDLGLLSAGGSIFMAHQLIKEALALAGTATALASAPTTVTLLPGG